MGSKEMPEKSTESSEQTAQPELKDVRRFWNENPLFTGESKHLPGARDFFEEHEKGTLHEYSGQLDPIFLRHIGPGSKVLDVGCGIGYWVDKFCRLGADVSACDLSDNSISITQRRCVLYGLASRLAVANAEQLPYADASFDQVNCQGVIHHTPHTERCLEEFHRVLKPGGQLCFSVYFKVWVLRSPLAFRAIMGMFRPWIALPGRGREQMSDTLSPAEFVRRYDGLGNPIGKAYTLPELKSMMRQRFRILEKRRVVLPRRALPFPLSDRLHKFLANRLGLTIVLRCQKT